MKVKDYRDLEIWQLGMDLAVKCYVATKAFPREELFSLTSQIRRAASSIPANIAEGQGRDHTREFLNHISIANGSLKELETHLLLANKIGLLIQSDLVSHHAYFVVWKMINKQNMQWLAATA
jgi:four helix bundle protein